MNIVRSLLIVALAVTPPVILLSYDKIGSWLAAMTSAQSKSTQLSKFEQHQRQVEAGLQAYQDFYRQEFTAYKNEVVQQWGEFKDAAPSTWISYDKSGDVRRSVDYETGDVQVEMIVNRGTGIDQVKGKLDEAVFRFMNTTEKEAYASDVVANRVEQKLTRYGDVLQQDEMSDERLFSMNDLLSLNINHDGYIRVSSQDKNIALTDVRPSAKKSKDIARVAFKIPHSIHQKAAKFTAAVTAAAAKERISDELIYAIMETESSFNPMAKSHIPAYGLMQIVPHTAGKDATAYLYGKAKILAPSYLYKPHNNITIGAAYLHVLHYKYMRKVKNKESRMYCAIAAYNTGASNVARAFIKRASFNKAVPAINKLSPQQVYQRLKKYLPRKETRAYIEKVSSRMEKYL